MDEIDHNTGVPLAGSGHSAEPETVQLGSAVPASVPNAATRMSQDEMWRRAEAAADFVFSPHLIGRLARVDAVTVAMRALMQLERDRAASVDRSPKGGNHEDGCHAKHESAVGVAETPNPSRQDTSPSSKDET